MTPHMFPSCLQKCFTCTNPSGISCPYKPQQHCQKGLRNIYDGCSMMSLMILLGSLLWLLLSSFSWHNPFVNARKIWSEAGERLFSTAGRGACTADLLCSPAKSKASCRALSINKLLSTVSEVYIVASRLCSTAPKLVLRRLSSFTTSSTVGRCWWRC